MKMSSSDTKARSKLTCHERRNSWFGQAISPFSTEFFRGIDEGGSRIRVIRTYPFLNHVMLRDYQEESFGKVAFEKAENAPILMAA